MNKFLLITYYWPPSGGAGVQRWVKFSKYIREFGWEPVVYTPANPEYPVIDESLVKDIPADLKVIKRPIWEPYNLFKWFTGKKKKERIYSGFINEKGRQTLIQKIAIFIRGNFFIPDARMFWIYPSVKFLKKYLKENQVDAIVSNGPPHSMHMIALRLKEIFPDLPWIADFRDPWTKIDFYEQLRLTSWGNRRHHRMEQKVLQKADRVVTVSPSWAEDFRALSGRDDIQVISNGYDPADFKPSTVFNSEHFSICHFGSMNRDRNPEVLWKALRELLHEIPELKKKLRLKLFGQTDFGVIQSAESYGLGDYIVRQNFIPHSKAVEEMHQAYLLLLPINNTLNQNGVVPGKLFEYIGAGRPILGIGPTSADASEIIKANSCGVMVDYQDINTMKEVILIYFQDFVSGKSNVMSEILSTYSRRQLAKEYAQLLSRVT